MPEKFKVTVSREDSKPVFAGADEDAVFLTEQSPLMIVKKDGGTVEMICGDITALLEFTARQMETLDKQQRRKLSGMFGLEFHSLEKT